MDNFNEICIFCGKTVESGKVVCVGQKGLASIINASINKNDGMHKKLADLKTIRVHEICRKNYTRTPYLKKGEQTSSKDSEPIPLRSTTGIFDFKSCCFICEREICIEKETRKAKQYREEIRVVTDIHMKERIVEICMKNNNDFCLKILSRLNNIIDLVAAEGMYHLSCYRNLTRKTETVPHEPSEKQIAFTKLCEYMENCGECQFLLQDLLMKFEEFCSADEHSYTSRWLREKLKKHFDHKIFMTSLRSGTIITLTDTAHTILSEKFYSEKCASLKEERLKIVRAASEIIREDIRKQVYSTDRYPTFSENLQEDCMVLIPESLKVFTDDVLKVSKNNNLQKKSISISHAIISSVRPNSFLSPLQIAFSVFLHRRFGSKILVEMTEKLGFSISYANTLLYESSVVASGQPNFNKNTFHQYVFDNADHNVRTLDGFGTFHAMGGIRCSTPNHKAHCERDVHKLKKQLSFKEIGSFGQIPIQTYKKNKNGLDKVHFLDLGLSDMQFGYSNIVQILKLDLLWVSGHWSGEASTPNWNGYMSLLVEGTKCFKTTEITALPFINLNPSDPSAIYTALLYARSEATKNGQQSCIVTFDQPLFQKASEIIYSKDMSIILRLGGFHLMMSFMGAIGFIMSGSGLEDLWSKIYARITVGHMIGGHAYSRAMRAHFLTQWALTILLMENFSGADRNILLDIHKKSYERITPFEDVIGNEDLSRVLDNFNSLSKALRNKNRTSRLWLQYHEMVTIIKLFLYAERYGDWSMHIAATKMMLPYLHAAGRLHYAKSAHLYVQNMLALEEVMPKNEFDDFCGNGYFTIRRTNKLWSGTWTDMCIEQFLMRSMKTSGGLTHGRGITESTLTKWVLTMPYSIEASNAIETFCGMQYGRTDQHIELRESRISRDNKDLHILLKWLQDHNPFGDDFPELACLTNGVVGEETVNCHEAREVGLESIQSMISRKFSEIHFKGKYKVKTLASIMKSVKVGDDSIILNQHQLFNRIICMKKSEHDLKNYFCYELAPSPPSLFNNFLMRKGNKASLLKLLKPKCIENPSNILYVLDGGWLLHCVVWPKMSTYREIINVYVSFILRNFGTDVQIVFDGYNNGPSTKDEEHRRRKNKKIPVEVLVGENTMVSLSQADFLSHEKNKFQLVKLIRIYLMKQNIISHEAHDDADRLIVLTAIDLAKLNEDKSIVIVGEDTDLFVLCIALCGTLSNLYFKKIGHGKNEDEHYKIDEQCKLFGKPLVENILFLHAVSGCDTTSYLYKKGKNAALKAFQSQSEDFKKMLLIFNDVQAEVENLLNIGHEFILSIYGLKGARNVNDERYKLYNKTIARQSLDKSFDLAVLPPSRDALDQHILRTYLQVQYWWGNSLPIENFGWKVRGNQFFPVTTKQSPAPEELLKLLFCKCKNGCRKKCVCSEVGRCNAMCQNCHGIDCQYAHISED